MVLFNKVIYSRFVLRLAVAFWIAPIASGTPIQAQEQPPAWRMVQNLPEGGAWKPGTLRRGPDGELKLVPGVTPPTQRGGGSRSGEPAQIDPRSRQAQPERAQPAREEHAPAGDAKPHTPRVVPRPLPSIEQGREQLPRLAAITMTMQPGEWRQIPNSVIPLITREEHDSIVAQTGVSAEFWGQSGPTAVVTAANSTAWDSEEHRWFFFGGGGAAYGGNEVYQFDFQTLQWTRLTDPQPLTDRATGATARNCPLPASGPPSSRTYDSIQWNPQTRSLWLLASPRPFCSSGNGGAPAVYWDFDPDTRQWTKHPRERDIGQFAFSFWDPWAQRIVALEKRIGFAGHIAEIDGSGNLHNVSAIGLPWSRYGQAVYDPARGIGYLIGEKRFFILEAYDDKWHIGNVIDLPEQMLGLEQSGFAYDDRLKRYVIWPGQNVVYTWDPNTKNFKKYRKLEGKPAPKGSRHVFNKFIYLRELAVFAGYNDPDSGVWLYRLPTAARDPAFAEPVGADDSAQAR